MQLLHKLGPPRGTNSDRQLIEGSQANYDSYCTSFKNSTQKIVMLALITSHH